MAELFLIARLAGSRIALPAEEVEAVVEIGALTPVPRAPVHVAGLAALRSRVLTVIDCLASLHPGECLSAVHEAVTVSVAGHPYALLVDGVEDVVEGTVASEARELPLTPDWRRIARSTIEADGDLLLVLDIEALVAGPPAPAAAA